MDTTWQDGFRTTLARAMILWGWELPDAIAETIEEADVWKILAETDWRPIVEQQVKQMEREERLERYATQWSIDTGLWWECDRCSQPIHYADRLTLEQITGGIHPHASASYCPSCATILRGEYTSTCIQCQHSFIGWEKGLATCLECLSQDRGYESQRVRQHLSYARRNERAATLTLEQWHETLDHFRGRCAWCQQRPIGCIDHFVPISAGGGTTAENSIPSCMQCNASKNSYRFAAIPNGKQRWQEIYDYLLSRSAQEKSA